MEQVYIGTTNYGRHWLSRPAAEAWQRMVRDGCPPQGITDAGRTQAEQETLFRKHFTTNYAASARIDRRSWAGQTWYRAYRPGTRTPWPSAATPGSPQARHQWGLSLDLNGTTKAWVRAHGRSYGWIKDVVSGEDWHMEYQASRDAVLVSNPGTSVGGSLPNPNLTPVTPIEEDDMYTDEDRKNATEIRRVLGVLGGGVAPATDGERKLVARLAALDALGGILHAVDECRRMLGVLLGWQPPQGPEQAALKGLRGQEDA